MRNFSTARRATVQICDHEGNHHGQGLLLDIEGEGAVVLTCHHIVAQLPPDAVYVRMPGEDGSLGAPRQAFYDEARSRPGADAVVLRLEGVHIPERPLLHQLEPLEYIGNLDAIILTHQTTTSFNATVSASTPINLSVRMPDSRLPSDSRYIIPQAFRLANPTDARQGISGGVVVCNAGVLGLAQSARKASDDRLAEVYLLPLQVWAEGWKALSDLIEPFVGEITDPYDYALQDYLRAIRIFSSDTPYLALDQILSGEKRALQEVYVPLRGRRASMGNLDSQTKERGESNTESAASDEDLTEQDAHPAEASIVREIGTPKVVTLADMLGGDGASTWSKHLLLQGGAGAGKSTALRHITALAWSRPHLLGLSKPHLPIVLRLQAMASAQGEGSSLEERLLSGLRHTDDLPLERTPPEGFFHEWSSRENAPWLLLLDGLDEVAAERRDGILRWVKDLLQMLEGQHRVVLTSRLASDRHYLELTDNFNVYDVLPFDEEQQHDFALRWFPDTADDFLTKVRRISAGSLFRESLSITPLLLTIAAAVYRRNGDLPESGQAELYRKFIDILFEEAGHKGLWDELGPEVSDIARRGLERLALAMTERSTENTLDALTQVSAEFLQEELDWGAARAETRSRQFVEVMSRRTGVFYRQGESFQWFHTTIREYLAGQSLGWQLRKSNNDYTTVIGERLLDRSWHDVLWSLSLNHRDRQGLIRWMSSEARDRFDAEAALLAYSCWQDSELAERETLKVDIIGAMAGGLGDDNSRLSARHDLKRYLIQMGGEAVEPLLALLEEYNGLQNQLLHEWNDKDQTPNRETESGKHIHIVYYLRRSIIEVLGEIGDERAVETLISLLANQDRTNNYRWHITDAAHAALRCIGYPAVDPLLARICDHTLQTQTRLNCLYALGAVGLRTTAVTPVLDTCLNEGLRGDAQLLTGSLRVASRLRDSAHPDLATTALISDDKEVIAAAARYLARMPDPLGINELHRTFVRWLSYEGDQFDKEWTLTGLAAALLATGNPKAKRTVSDFIKSRLKDEGKIALGDTIQAEDEMRLKAFPRLLLQELIRRLNLPDPGIVIDRLVRRLSAIWHPEEICSLATATRKSKGYASDEGGLASSLIDICTGTRQESEGGQTQLRDYLDRKEVVRMLAKCHVPDFVEQAKRLLPDAAFWFTSELSDALWIVGDTSAEEALLAALNNYVRPTEQANRPMPEEYHIIRALGTCCTDRGVEAVLDYIHENPQLSIDMPYEVLYTLVRRSVLDVSTLIQMAQDMTGTHEFVRHACVSALRILDAQQFTPVFLQVIAAETYEEARASAVHSLGWSKAERGRVIQALQDLLATTNKPYLAERAAQSLVRLGHRKSLGLIERAIDRFGSAESTSGLLLAAARFRARSTLRLLEKAFEEPRAHSYLHIEAEMISAFGEFYQKEASARRMVDAQLESSHRAFDAGKQAIAVRVLATRNPNHLLQRATRLYDERRLDSSACLALINCALRLSKSKRVDPIGLVEIMKRLLCESDMSLRERAGESLQFIAAPVRTRIYDELLAMDSEWAQACAVYSLAFWNSDEKVIESARFDASPIVRQLASTAFVIRSQRFALRQSARIFRTTRGLTRLSAYFALLEQATNPLVDTLYRDTRVDDLTRIHLRKLEEGVKRRVKEERQKRLKEEQHAICEKVQYISFV